MARMRFVEASSCFDILCICTNSTQNSAVFCFLHHNLNQPTQKKFSHTRRRTSLLIFFMRWSSFVNSTQLIVLPMPLILPQTLNAFCPTLMDLKVVASPTAPHLQFQKLLQAYQADFGFKKNIYVLMETLEWAAAKTDFLHWYIFFGLWRNWWKFLHISLSLSLSLSLYIYIYILANLLIKKIISRNFHSSVGHLNNT